MGVAYLLPYIHACRLLVVWYLLQEFRHKLHWFHVLIYIPPGLSDNAASKAALSRHKCQQEECRRCCQPPMPLHYSCHPLSWKVLRAEDKHQLLIQTSPCYLLCQTAVEGAILDHKASFLRLVGRWDRILHVLFPWGTQSFITGVSKLSKKGPDYCPSDFRGGPVSGWWD